MKHTIILIAGLLLFGSAMAQEEKTERFELSASTGITTMVNYPGVSLAQDNVPSYRTLGVALHVGYRLKPTAMLGLRYQQASFSTPAAGLDESTKMYMVGPMLRLNERIGKRFEIMAGARLGLSVCDVHYSYLGEGREGNFQTRYGMFGEMELGVNYLFSGGLYVGVNASVLYVSHSDNNFELPAGYIKNTNLLFGGYSLMLTYGVRF